MTNGQSLTPQFASRDSSALDQAGKLTTIITQGWAIGVAGGSSLILSGASA